MSVELLGLPGSGKSALVAKWRAGPGADRGVFVFDNRGLVRRGLGRDSLRDFVFRTAWLLRYFVLLGPAGLAAFFRSRRKGLFLSQIAKLSYRVTRLRGAAEGREAAVMLRADSGCLQPVLEGFCLLSRDEILSYFLKVLDVLPLPSRVLVLDVPPELAVGIEASRPRPRFAGTVAADELARIYSEAAVFLRETAGRLERAGVLCRTAAHSYGNEWEALLKNMDEILSLDARRGAGA